MAKYVFGVKNTINRKLSDKNALEDADRLAQGAMVRIGTDAANRAPVKTGLLQQTMTTGIQRSKSKPKGAWDLLQETEYTLVQEFEHKSKSHFIENAVMTEAPHFYTAMEERFRKGGRR